MEAHEPRHKQRLSSSRIFIKASGQQGTVKVPKGFANGTVRDLKKWYSSHDIVFTHLGRPMPDGLEMCSFNFRCSNTIFSTIFSTKDTRKRTSPDPDSKTSNRQKNERPDPRSKTSFSTIFSTKDTRKRTTIFSTKDTRKRTSPDPDSKTSNRQKNERPPDPSSKTSRKRAKKEKRKAGGAATWVPIPVKVHRSLEERGPCSIPECIELKAHPLWQIDKLLEAYIKKVNTLCDSSDKLIQAMPKGAKCMWLRENQLIPIPQNSTRMATTMEFLQLSEDVGRCLQMCIVPEKEAAKEVTRSKAAVGALFGGAAKAGDAKPAAASGFSFGSGGAAKDEAASGAAVGAAKAGDAKPAAASGFSFGAGGASRDEAASGAAVAISVQVHFEKSPFVIVD